MKKLLVLFLLSSFSLLAGPYAVVNSEPAVGAGARGNISHHGLDISSTIEPRKTEQHFKGKALYMFYPHPELQSRPYIGLGPTMRYNAKTIPVVGPEKQWKGEIGSEAVIGYEFRYRDKMKMFSQFEVSNPHTHEPTFGISVGFGF